MKVRHCAEIVIGDYQFAESFNKEVLYQLQFAKNIGHTNVKAFHTVWNWLPNNKKIINFKSFINAEIKKYYKPNHTITNHDFWANVYKKGDYTTKHNHEPIPFSFAYFVKAKWYDSPLVFTESNKKIRPKEGRYIIFPGCLNHHVPKHRYNHERITLSGNYKAEI
jgi:hypothetical protein